jgi:hypothetical protein
MHHSPTAEPVAFIEFTEGEPRPVFETPGGRQFVVEDDGERVYGVCGSSRPMPSVMRL